MTIWKNKYIKPNKFSRPQEKIKDVRKIVIHWTANFGGTAMNHYNYFNNLSGRYASAHLFVDKNEALCIIPLEEITYHANDGIFRGIPELKPNANYLSIGIEMCVERDGTFHKDTIARSEDVAVELCKIYKLDPLKDIVRHFDVTKKSCPAPWVKNSKEFIEFKERVNKKFTGKVTVTSNSKVEEEDDVMKFTNKATETAVRTFIEQSVNKDLIDKSWLAKFDSDKMTYGDYLGLQIIVNNRK